MSEWLELPSPVTQPGQRYSLVRVQKISIRWSQHSVRFTNIREHCVSRPWALRNCQNPWDSQVIRETWQVWANLTSSKCTILVACSCNVLRAVVCPSCRFRGTLCDSLYVSLNVPCLCDWLPRSCVEDFRNTHKGTLRILRALYTSRFWACRTWLLILGCRGIHVKSPGFAGRLPEFSQIPRSPGRENESPGFLSYWNQTKVHINGRKSK